MKAHNSQITRTTIVLLTVMSFLFSLTPRVPAKSTMPAKNSPVPTAAPSSDAKARASASYGNLPLSFEPNRGQADEHVKFLTRGSGYALFLTATDALLALNGPDETAQGLRMKLVGSNPAAKLAGERQLEGKSNYLIGNNQRKWTREIPTFAKVRSAGVYPGVDIVYYGSDQRRLEYDFVVAPGSDPGRIRLAFEGADALSLDADGGLRLKTKAGDIVQPAPVVYQETGGQRQTVAGHYVLASGNEVVFEIAEYDRSRTLVIDPKIIYASFHGGSGNDLSAGIAVDASGNAYVVGSTPSANLPLTAPLQGTLKGTSDIFIVKINATGTAKTYSTYLGGSTGESGFGIAVMSDGKVCIAGSTDNTGNNSDYPTTSGRFQGNGSFLGDHGIDAVMTVLNPAGNSLFYSTFIAGGENESAQGIAVDGSNKVYITGTTLSRNFPTKNEFPNASTDFSAFVAKFDPTLSGNSSLIYSSILGGTADRTDASAIAVTAGGVAFITGTTEANNFQTKSSSSLPPFQTNYGGGFQDSYIAKVSTTGGLIYSTYFGGNGDDVTTAIAVDANERAYVTGVTTSSAATFPLKNAFDSTRSGTKDAWVAKFNADGTTLFYSSFISGSNVATQGEGIDVDSDGSAFVTGSSVQGSVAFPVVTGFPASVPNGPMFLVKVGPSDATGTTVPTIQFSDTMAGGGPAGLALDGKGNVYIAGTVSSGASPLITPGAFQQTHGGGPNDAWVIKINFPPPDTIGVFRPNQFLLRNSNTTGPADITLGFGQAGDQPLAGDWNGDGIDDVGVFRPSTGQFILHQLTVLPGFPPHVITSLTINFGQAGDLAVVGDWLGNGVDTPGVFRPSTGQWLLTTVQNVNNSAPPANITFNFGQVGDTPIAGDWNGDGVDTVGLFRGSAATFILSNTFNGTIDITPFFFGSLGSVPLAGDWDGDGVDTIGTFQANIGTMTLNNTNTSGNGVGDLVFNFGQSGDLPVAGDWDGKP